MQFDSTTDSLSHWHATADTLHPSDSLPDTADAVVVGGGMLGCWTALWLSKSGLKPVVLERGAVGWGATGRNGGFLVGGAGTGYASLIDLLGRENARAIHTLTLDGQRLAQQVISEEGIECDYRQCGSLSLALNADELESMSRSIALLHEDGFGGELLNRDGVQQHIDTPLATEIVGGTLTSEDGALHSVRYLRGVASAAQRLGARFVQATATRVDGNTVTTDRGEISAGGVVVALNAWTSDLVPDARYVIVPTRGQILAYAPSDPVFNTAAGASITPTGEYWQQTPSGHIVIGGCRADAPNGDSDVREMVPTDAVIERIDTVLPRLFPNLNDLTIERRWAGLMAFTPDHLPIVDRAGSGAWFAGGFSGHGMPYGPILGKMLAQAVVDGEMDVQALPLGMNRASLQSR